MYTYIIYIYRYNYIDIWWYMCIYIYTYLCAWCHGYLISNMIVGFVWNNCSIGKTSSGMTIMLTIKSAWSACVGVCPVSRHIHIEHAVSSWKDHGRNVDVRRYGWHGPTRIINMSGVLGGQGVWSLRATHDCAIGCRLSCCTTENPPWDYRFCHQHVTYPQATKHWPWENPCICKSMFFF